MTPQEQIQEMTASPYHYSLTIEYDREVITIRLYNQWENKTEFLDSKVTTILDNLVNKTYIHFKTLKD